MKAKCLIIAHYKFTDKDGKEVDTTKAIIDLGNYGQVVSCSSLLNDKPLYTEANIVIEFKGKKFIIKSVG